MAVHAQAGLGEDSPQHWLGSTPLLDLGDPRLRMRARSLMQLCRTDRDKALAAHAFVKRLPYTRAFKLRPRTARQVLDAGCGDAPDKATLLVALLRLAGLPARMRLVQMRGEIMRGIIDGLSVVHRPFVEVWIDGEWLSTDVYIFDASYLASARQALKDQGGTWGFGVHVASPMVWTGRESTSISPLPFAQDPMVVEELGAFHDPADYMRSRAFRRRHRQIARFLRWNINLPKIRRAIHRLRQGRPVPSGLQVPNRR